MPKSGNKISAQPPASCEGQGLARGDSLALLGYRYSQDPATSDANWVTSCKLHNFSTLCQHLLSCGTPGYPPRTTFWWALQAAA